MPPKYSVPKSLLDACYHACPEMRVELQNCSQKPLEIYESLLFRNLRLKGNVNHQTLKNVKNCQGDEPFDVLLIDPIEEEPNKQKKVPYGIRFCIELLKKNQHYRFKSI
jgi:hypothetical protein